MLFLLSVFTRYFAAYSSLRSYTPSTFFLPVTTIAPGMKQAERCCLARTFWRVYVSNDTTQTL